MATTKQQKALANLVENGGSVSKAMRDAGYSAKTARTPSKLTESVAFRLYMEEMGVDDKKIIQVLKEGLDANKTVVMGKDSGESFVDIQPDHPTRHKFLETTLKLRGLYKDGAVSPSVHFHQHVEEKKERYDF